MQWQAGAPAPAAALAAPIPLCAALGQALLAQREGLAEKRL